MGNMYSRTPKRGNMTYPVNIEYYNSANDVADDCTHRHLRSGGWLRPSTDSDWTGCRSIGEAYELLRTGYEPAVEQLDREFKLANQQSKECKRTSFKNNICGYAPVVPLAMLGVPNSMVNMTMEPIKTKVVDIYYDMTVNCLVGSDDIIQSGINILSAILDLERQGYRFNLYSIQTYADSQDCDMLIVKIKDARQPLDLRRMSFPMCHTGFFRLIGFDWYGKNPKSRYRTNYGHEARREFNANGWKEFVKATLGDTAVYLCCSKLVKQSKDEQKEYIKGVLTNVRKNPTS